MPPDTLRSRTMASPTLRRKALGKELRKLRTQHNETVEQIALLLGCSAGKVRHMEYGRTPPSKPVLMVLLEHFKVPQRDRYFLEEIRQEASKRGWWSTYRLPAWLHEYVGMESDALRVRSFELELIPGLLQVPDYVRAIYAAGDNATTREGAERGVALRAQRQKRLHDDEPLELITVISEAALWRCASEPSAAPAQLHHLLDAGQMPNITIRVLPFHAGVHASLAGSFHLLEFPPDTWPLAAYTEYAAGGHLIDDDRAVADFDAVFTRLLGKALDEEESAALIKKIAATASHSEKGTTT